MTKKPEVPKRLASMLNGAYRDVVTAQQSILASEHNSATDRARIQEYESDPASFARKYYGNNSPDSYPVQTTIARCREGLERRALRKDEEYERLRITLERQDAVEQEVLAKLQALRPGTPGRVPWPKPPRTLSRQRAIDQRYSEWLTKKNDSEMAADDVAFEAEMAAYEAEHERELALQREKMDRWIEQMSEDDRTSFKQRVGDRVEAVRRGGMSIVDIAITWEEIEAEAERLAEKGRSGKRGTG